MNLEQTHRKVSLTEQITLRILNGFDIAPEEIVEAKSLGISVEAIAEKLGVCYESIED